MSTRRLLRRMERFVKNRYSRVTTPMLNRRLDAQFAANPGGVLDRMDRAIDRGISWLEPQQDVSMSVLLCATRTLQRTGDSRFVWIREQLERYRNTVRDPALLMFYDDYDPDDPSISHIPNVQEVRPYVPVELLMLDTVWAGKRPQPDILDRLKAFDDNGFYGTTHIVVGGLILLENGGAPEAAVRDAIAATVEPIVRANEATTVADDIYAERAMVLHWIGEGHRIRPSWMMRLLDSQRADGGWQAANMPPVGLSNQHTTIVALAALTEYLHRHAASRR